MEVARSAPKGTLYHGDVFFTFSLNWGSRRGHGVYGTLSKVLDQHILNRVEQHTFALYV